MDVQDTARLSLMVCPSQAGAVRLAEHTLKPHVESPYPSTELSYLSLSIPSRCFIDPSACLKPIPPPVLCILFASYLFSKLSLSVISFIYSVIVNWIDPHSRVATMHAPSCPRSTLLPTLSNKEPCRVQSCHGSNAHGASFKHTVSSRYSALKQTCYTALTSCCHLPFLQTAYLNKN